MSNSTFSYIPLTHLQFDYGINFQFNKETWQPLWRQYFESFLGFSYPLQVVSTCCSQGIVSRATIRRLPIEFWEGMVQLSLQMTTHSIGIYFLEFTTHMIFGRPPRNAMDNVQVKQPHLMYPAEDGDFSKPAREMSVEEQTSLGLLADDS